MISGASIIDINFGYYPIGAGIIGDLVWMDIDGDQVADPFETRLSDISVDLTSDLDEDGVYTTVTLETSDIDGIYGFQDLPDGLYRVIVDTTDGDLPMDIYGELPLATTPVIYDVVIHLGEVVEINGVSCMSCELDIDFGWAFLGAIGDQVFFDINSNALQDLTKNGIPGVQILLCDAATVTCDLSTSLRTTTTDVSAGTTNIGFDIPAAISLIYKAKGS